MITCNVCLQEVKDAIFESTAKRSLTSLCELRNTQTIVYFCHACGHLFMPPLVETAKYYATDYRILLSHDEEDQVYDTVDEKVIYRTDHQMATIAQKLSLSKYGRILDFGCAKSSMTKRLKNKFPEKEYHLFDVSDMYVPYWKEMLPESNWAINFTPDHWAESFDLVTSFFSLEHIPTPRQSIEHIHSLLRTDGVLYGIVPNVFTNPADFIVVDHNNHFTVESLTYLLSASGFDNIQIDSECHRGALVFSARKTVKRTWNAHTSRLIADVSKLADFWRNIGDKIRVLEMQAEAPYAIYGSGFYGAYVYANLENPSKVSCFLDRSPYQQGKKLFEVEIISPEMLPATIRTIFVGLNPLIARKAISEIPSLRKLNLKINFLS